MAKEFNGGNTVGSSLRLHSGMSIRETKRMIRIQEEKPRRWRKI